MTIPKDIQHHLAQEEKMQKFRILTPIGLVLLGCIVTAGFTLLGWCGDTVVQSLNAHFATIEHKQDILFDKVSSIANKENADVLCLTRNLYECCGNKASANC